MKRTYTNQEMTRILKQELVIPEKVDRGMQEAYMKLGIKKPGKTTFFLKRKVLRILAAAAVLTAGSSIVVFAANKFLSANLVKEEEAVTYDLTIDHNQETHEIEVEPTYIPEGYVLYGENTPLGGKWHNDETGGTISIFTMNAAELDEYIRLGNTDELTHGMKEKNLKEEIEINGMKVALFMPDSAYIDSDKTTVKAMLFNEEDGYLINIYHNSQLSKEETIKIAKGLDIRVLDSTVPYKTDEEIDKLLAEQKFDEEQRKARMKPELLADNNFFSIGTELKLPFTEFEDGTKMDDFRYTVESIEVKDRLPVSEYPTENYYDYDGEMADWLNEDGTLKSHERFKYTYDASGNETGVPLVQTVASKFVVVHMKLKNNNEVNLFDNEVMVCPFLKYLDKDENGFSRSDATDLQYFPANENYHLTTDGFPVYFDKMYYTDGIERLKRFHFVPMEPGEELEYTLAYVVDEDLLDNAFFQFYSGYDGYPVPEGGNEYVYVKVEQ